MEMRLPLMLAVLLGALCAVVSSLALPHADLTDSDVQLDGSDSQDLDDSRRAIWLETRELDQAFKEMVFSAMVELEKEGRIVKGVITEEEAKQKRGRWQGFCFRRTRSGRFLPYICWKGDRK